MLAARMHAYHQPLVLEGRSRAGGAAGRDSRQSESRRHVPDRRATFEWLFPQVCGVVFSTYARP